MPSVARTYRNNLELTYRSDFSREMSKEILDVQAGVVRIHVAGDFYDVGYTSKWLEIIQACPDTQFYAYTRSWALEPFVPILGKMAEQHNMWLWFSCDRAMPWPPEVPNVRTAYMSVSDDDVPQQRPDLVFRTNRKTSMKWMGDTLVCPVEQGIKRKAEMTCDRCRICLEAPRASLSRDRSEPQLVQIT